MLLFVATWPPKRQHRNLDIFIIWCVISSENGPQISPATPARNKVFAEGRRNITISTSRPPGHMGGAFSLIKSSSVTICQYTPALTMTDHDRSSCRTKFGKYMSWNTASTFFQVILALIGSTASALKRVLQTSACPQGISPCLQYGSLRASL